MRFDTVIGPEWSDGRVKVTPVARTLTIGGGSEAPVSERTSGRRAMLVRTRPRAVLVSADGRTSRLPIVDLTRSAQAAMLLAALLWLWELRTWTRTRKERS
jgi:hypothetical protein